MRLGGTLKQHVARAVRRSTALTCLAYMIDDWRARRRLARGDVATRSGARHAALDLEQSLVYVQRIHADYLDYGGRKKFNGRVAEIGPGDNFGVALLLRGDGVDEVHAIDRYASARDAARQAAIYAALAKRHDLGALFDGPPSEDTITGLTQHIGVPAERFFRESGLRFDAILSRAVMEHLYDPLAALDDMAASLLPGGVIVHRIDFRDHGMFAGRHPLTFLTIAEPLYRRMTQSAGRPNRVLLPAWRDWLLKSKLDGSLRITRLAGVDGEIPPSAWDDIDPALRGQAIDCVRTIRPRLCRSLRGFANEDLAVAGAVLVAEKTRA